MEKGKVDVVVGLQRGDEGKGRVTDYLAPDYSIVGRYGGGSNAGHKIKLTDEQALTLHLVPSGIACPGVENLIGNGVLLDPLQLLKEVEELKANGFTVNGSQEESPQNLFVSDGAVLTLPHHIARDLRRENGPEGQGSTKKGIAPTAADKYNRSAVFAEQLLREPDAVERLVFDGLRKVISNFTSDYFLREHASAWVERALAISPYVIDAVPWLKTRLDNGRSVLAEGNQGLMLDIEHGMKPLTTSAHTTVGGAINGLGISHKQVGEVIGVAKLVRSSVGKAAFVTRVEDEKLAERIRGERGLIDSEYGGTTGRPRDVGYIDLVELRKGVYLNGVDYLALNKLDQLTRYGKTILICTAYESDSGKLNMAPSWAAALDHCRPDYKELPLWNGDISQIRTYEALPKEAKAILDFIARDLQVEVGLVGVGPGREQLIVKNG